MKKPVIIWVSALVLLASASLLFAQTTTGSSLITEMKAAIRPFTLAGQLNPGVTDLNSSPVVGKKTGDMLTAGEWNRVLELIGQGGGGASWVDVPLTDTADYDTSCIYKYFIDYLVDDANRKWFDSTSGTYMTGAFSAKFLGAELFGNNYFGIPSVTKGKYGYRTNTGIFTESTNVRVTKMVKLCGGSGGGGGGGTSWVDVPLTGTENFDVACQYRMRSEWNTSWVYIWQVAPSNLAFAVSTAIYSYIAIIPKEEKWFWDYHQHGNTAIKYQNNVMAVAQIQKQCGGGGGGGGGGWVNLSEQTYNAPTVRDVTGNGPYFISCTRTDAAYYCGMQGSVLVSMTCKDVGINMVVGANYNSGQWSADDHYVVGGANRGIDVLKCANGIGTITDVWE